MTMRTMLVALALIASAGASAQTTPQPMQDISGKWVFQTILVKRGCKIEGDISFTRQDKSDSYTCTFVSTETCGKGLGVSWWKVRQSCTVKANNGAFDIKSKVEEMLDAAPESARVAMNNGRYSPDNFSVRPLNDKVMAGQFFSIDVAAVRFERVVERVS
jgi:hypothetical protein